MIQDMVIGRLHRFEGDWVLVIVEYEGRDIRAIFRRDEVEVSGEGTNEIVGIKTSVLRKVPTEGEGGAKKEVEKEFSVEPHDAVWVKHRHQTPVVVPKAIMDKITALASNSTLTLTRP